MRSVRVPASSANLGPGFDTLAVALDLHLEVGWEPSDCVRIEVTGRDAACIPADESNLIWTTVARYSAAPLVLKIDNGIPIGKGLGSSAAALTAAIAIGNPEWTPFQVMNECARLEGHPDNAAACALGGIVASSTDCRGVTQAVRLELPREICVGAVVPPFALPTKEARAALPECYSRADAVFNLQRTALLVAAVAQGNLQALTAALEDALHQPYRAPLIPGLGAILKLRAPGLLGCVLSGAGPSVLVFYQRGHDECCDLVAREFRAVGSDPEVIRCAVAHRGFHYTPRRLP